MVRRDGLAVGDMSTEMTTARGRRQDSQTNVVAVHTFVEGAMQPSAVQYHRVVHWQLMALYLTSQRRIAIFIWPGQYSTVFPDTISNMLSLFALPSAPTTQAELSERAQPLIVIPGN